MLNDDTMKKLRHIKERWEKNEDEQLDYNEIIEKILDALTFGSDVTEALEEIENEDFGSDEEEEDGSDHSNFWNLPVNPVKPIAKPCPKYRKPVYPMPLTGLLIEEEYKKLLRRKQANRRKKHTKKKNTSVRHAPARTGRLVYYKGRNVHKGRKKCQTKSK